MSGRGWKVYALVAALLISVYQVLPANVWLLSAWQVGIGWIGAAVIVFGVRHLPRRDRLPWWCFAFGVFANSSGIPASYFSINVLKLPGLPTPADAFFLLLYPACAVGLALMVRRREGKRRNWTAMVDATTITTGFGLLAWVYVIEPAAAAGGLTMFGRAVQAAYPIGDLLLLGMMTRLLRGSGTRGAPFWWITGSLGAFLAGDTVYVVLGNMGAEGLALQNSVTFHRWLDAIFLAAYVMFGVAAMHANARQVQAPAGEQLVRLTSTQLLLLTGASLIAPAMLAFELHGGKVKDGTAIVVGCTALFLLVVTRMAQLLRELEKQAGQVRELSRRDELTGLPNRRAWSDELPRALEMARRDGKPICVALLDLDHFKQFNDSYGHPAGDRLLKEASAAWYGELRGSDILARYGGEEFIALLPGADVEAARKVIGRASAVTPLGQTFSAGVALWDGAETSDELIQRADAALYAAKAAGRNRVEAAPRMTEPQTIDAA